jgi:uncharacterized protein involved in exopolysaccharide biosynthesis
MNTKQHPENYPPYPYPQKFAYEEDEIDLLELWNTLWKGKWFIIGFTFICTIIAVAYALLATPIYKAEVLLAPVEEESSQGGLGSFASQYGGIASLAGINLGGSSSNIETNIATLKSREFIYRFIKDNELMPVLFEDMWDKGKKAWISNDPEEIPTQWKAYNVLLESILKIDRDKDTGLVKLNILWKDPKLATKWANDLVDRINAHIRAKAVTEAQKSIDYLEQEIAKSSDVSMREILYRLIEKQAQTITLAQVREQYAFSIIDPAVVPEKWDKPNRRLIVVLGTVVGGFISIFLQFFSVFIQNVRKRKQEEEALEEKERIADSI